MFFKSLPHVALFVSLAVSCSAKPTYQKPPSVRHLTKRVGSPTPSDDYVPPNGITETVIGTSGNNRLAGVTINDLNKKLKLLVDTGSCWTWIKKESLGSHDLEDNMGNFKIGYAMGHVVGKAYNVKITVGDGIVIPQQTIGVAEEYDDDARRSSWDGIMGLSTTCDDNAPSPISIIENLVSGDPDTDKVKQNSLGLCFKPFEELGEDKDKLTWGGIDSSCYEDKMTFVPVLSHLRALPGKPLLHWPLPLSSVSYQNQDIQGKVPVTLDSATTEILLAPSAYEKFSRAVGGTKENHRTRVSAENFRKMGDLVFVIAGKPYTLTPHALASGSGESPAASGSGRGDDVMLRVDESDMTLLGAPFFDRYYAYLDSVNEEVGLASTKYTFSKGK